MRNSVVLLIALAMELAAQTVRVPFVGCPADGQTGPIEAPKRADDVVRVRASAAKNLAYYKASSGRGVLAPRGWHCFGVYGSSGSSLFVTLRPIKSQELFSSKSGGIAGPVIQISNTYGDTSGRFGVARVIARVFPAHKAFVQDVVDEGIEPASEFVAGAYPADKLIEQSDLIVEYQTPPHGEGLGTVGGVKANDDPIDGVALLDGPTPDLVMLRVRLPRELRDLAPVIIHDLLVRQRRDAR